MAFAVVAARSDQAAEVFDLMRKSFAYMEGRIDPPSSLIRLNIEKIMQRQTNGDVFVIGDPIEACMFIDEKGDALYLGKVSIVQRLRGAGRFAALINYAETEAIKRGLVALEIESRIELTEVHAAFERQGFVETRKGTHEGFTVPTFIEMRKALV